MNSFADTPTFRKSTYSSTDRDCVEIADLPTGAAVRDTQHRDLGYLTFADSSEWRAFLAVARRDSL
ncbi:DUF397 domain-containing protein [Nocardiopsis sp. NRRL B-16309]|uniref:DUF397 domain-containing protein n=1 Tax=Nocardiopsis sp. NRRL B-16309 TaxID=1519494 RepID=UPI0006AD8DAF|nr:DUF397 domain-containing protein [Nocardiopsis sp. NRRL B-16309]KOX17701.1 hypothetical protein ADL05_08660 [Nocardiopsis sp. NRRL B-16309]